MTEAQPRRNKKADEESSRQNETRKPQGPGCARVILWEVETGMTYTLRLYLYLFVAGVVAVMGAVWLSPLGLTVNIILAVVVAYLGSSLDAGCSGVRICSAPAP